MDDDLLSIGALSRAGGIPVTALRFYDAAGVLRPAHVDPVTGYRWYTSAQVHRARLAASLRQAGLPVAELIEVIARPSQAQAALERHRRRLEDDLAVAAAHLRAAEGLLAQAGRGTVVASDLVSALGAVRHAVGTADPDWPGLAGVLLHLDGTTLRAVACDRARIAVATVPVRHPAGPAVRVVVSRALVDQVVTAARPTTSDVELSLTSVDVLGVRGEPMDAEYPDYERLLATAGARSVTAETSDLLRSLGEAEEIVVVNLRRGRVEISEPGADDATAFSRSFLLDAVRAVRAARVDLTVDERRSALRVAAAGCTSDVGLVMPVRLAVGR